MSDLSSVDPPIGALLRAARLDRELTIEDVRARLKISARALEALEEERWDDLPGRVYVEGFLRRYAEFLELDPDALLHQLRKRLGAPTRLEIGHPRPVPEAQTNGGFGPVRVGLLFVLGVVLTASTIYVVRKPDFSIPGFDRPLSQVAELPPPPPDSPSEAPGPGTAPTFRHSVGFQVKDSVWVSVRLDKQLRYEGLLDAGETRRWGFDDLVQVRVGNASRIAMEVDGETVPVPLGSSAATIVWPPASRPPAVRPSTARSLGSSLPRPEKPAPPTPGTPVNKTPVVPRPTASVSSPASPDSPSSPSTP